MEQREGQELYGKCYTDLLRNLALTLLLSALVCFAGVLFL